MGMTLPPAPTPGPSPVPRAFRRAGDRLGMGVILASLLTLLSLSVRRAEAGGVVAPCTEASLRAAVAGGGGVTFNCGGPATITLTGGPITLTANTTMDGGGQVTVSGNNTSGVFITNDNLTVTFRNLSIVNGRSNDQGAGLKVGFWNTLTIENVTFNNNVSLKDTAQCDGGGAVFIGGGSTATITGSTFTNNQANNGGAINSLRTDLTLIGNTFTNNRAQHTAQMDSFGDCGGGGAVYLDGANSFNKASASTLSRNDFLNNTANNHGGAVFIGVYANETVTVDRSYFSGNRTTLNTLGQAGTGGGIWYGAGVPGQTVNALIVSDSTFANNHADSQGGGLWTSAGARITNGTFIGNVALNPNIADVYDWRRGNGGALVGAAGVELMNSLLANNTAGFNGGAVAGSGTNPNSPILVRNTLIANNTGGNGWGIQQQCTSALTDGGNNLQWPNKATNNWNDYVCVTTMAAVNPAHTLGALSDNGGQVPTVALLPGSPALNAGNPATCTAVDARGLPRSRGGVCDIGAYETITQLAAVPGLIGMNEPSVTLTVLGDGFANGQQIAWGGAPVATSFVDRFTLTAGLTSGQYGTPGSVSVSVSGSSLTAASVQVVPVIRRVYLPLVLR